MISFRQLFRRRRIYEDMQEEIRAHLDEQVDALMAEGMTRTDAEAAARRRFGNVTRIEEKGREAWMMPKLERLLADLRFALRRLKSSPGFSLTAVLTLAMGIGANVVVFSLLNGLILRPLNVPNPGNLWQVSRGRNGVDSQSWPDYRDFRGRSSSFTGLMAYKTLGAGLTAGKSTVRSWGYATSGNYFDVLGIHPALGRFFHAPDTHGLGSAPLLVLSYAFWQSEFGGRQDVIGKVVTLNEHPFTVIGVAARGFYGTNVFIAPDYWMPIVNAQQVTGWDDFCCRDHYGITVEGRLKPGVTPQQADQALNAMAAQMAKEQIKDDGLILDVRRPGPAGDKNDPLEKSLLGMVLLSALVLLAACANLASIFAARAADRAGELAVRMAIGASRWLVLRQLLAEAILISLAGGAAGVFLARLLLGWLSQWKRFGDLPTRLPVIPDSRVYLLAIALSLASGILFGILPSRQIWRTDVVTAIKSGYAWSESFRRFAFRDLLLLIQIAVCTLLVTATAMSIRGMQRAMRIPLGFTPQRVTIAQGDLNMAGYTGDTALPVQKRILAEAQAIPGVTSAALADFVPFGQGGTDWFVYRWGTTDFIPAHMVFAATTYLVSPEYLHTAETPLLRGRNFTWHDDKTVPNVAIVNRTFAKLLYGNQSPIGKRFELWAQAKYQIVGEVPDGEYGSVGEKPQPMMMMPFAQGTGSYLSTATCLLVRSNLPQQQITAALQPILRREAPEVPFSLESWTDYVNGSLLLAQAVTMVLMALGLLAVMLAITGIFGMASYSVSRRMKELGVRIALGAQQRQVVRAMLRRPALLLCYGSVLGMGAGLLATRVMEHLGEMVTPWDPLVIVIVCAAMVLIGVTATWAPARRTLAVDPARLLREP